MDLNIFSVLLLTLFAGGHSLKCNECAGVTGSCVSKETTCPSNATTCASATVISSGATTVSVQIKTCEVIQNCANASINFGVTRTGVSMQCCNTDLCNSKDVPDYSSTSPNGKQCFYCDGNGCWNTLNCLGNEDYCIKATATSETLPTTVKGCASKNICDAVSQVPQGVVDFSCCQGDLCNGAKSVTQNILFLFWPFFFYILIH